MNRSIIYCLLLCIFLACGDNDYETLVPEEVAPGDSTDPGDTTETLEDYWNYFCHGYQVKDTSGLNRVFLNPFYPENEEVVYLSGIRNNRLWVGTFDATTRKQTSDFLDSEPLPDSYSHHVGYGEYKTGELTSPIISFIEQKGDHTTILFKLALGENENAGWYERDYRLLLFAGNLISKNTFIILTTIILISC